MNSTTSHTPAPGYAQPFRALVSTGVLVWACVFGPPSFAQSPAPNASATVSATAGNLPVANNAAQPTAATDGGAGHAGNPYGLRVVWAQGDGVARTTLLLLALMSVLSWYVIVSKLIQQRRQSIQAQSARDAWFSLGYVHAQERGWQLEFNRRVMHGELSEVLGPATPSSR